MQRSVLSQSLLASQAILKDSKFVKIENEIKQLVDSREVQKDYI